MVHALWANSDIQPAVQNLPHPAAHILDHLWHHGTPIIVHMAMLVLLVPGCSHGMGLSPVSPPTLTLLEARNADHGLQGTVDGAAIQSSSGPAKPLPQPPGTHPQMQTMNPHHCQLHVLWCQQQHHPLERPHAATIWLGTDVHPMANCEQQPSTWPCLLDQGRPC